MPDIALPCSCCGLPLVYGDDLPVRECPACGTPNARPMVEDAAIDVLRHATRQRLGCDFTNAERSYQQVLLDHPDAHEALWGRLLCHYGVEYVKDPATDKLMPTVHTVRRKPLRTQIEFRDACEFAPEAVRARYEAEAAYIDDAQTAIRMAATSCPPYDVFICHKTTKPGTEDKTEDFHRAFQLFTYLERQGFRPFFAPDSLLGFAGADYEAGIYHALDTSKVMLVLCSQKDWLTSAWVRSEWSRFMERIDDGADKRIVPLFYDNFSPAHLPAEFRYRRIQGFPMGELTSTEKLMEMLRGALGKQEAPAVRPQPVMAVPVPTQEPVSPAPKPEPKLEPPRPAPKPASAPVAKAGVSPEESFVVSSYKDGCIIVKYTGEQTEIRIPSTIKGMPVREVGVSVFANRPIRSVHIPDGVVSIGEEAFYGCQDLVEVQIPNSVTSIGILAFSCCASLQHVTLPGKLKDICNGAFSSCYALKEINIPDRVTIHSCAFDGCQSLPESIKKQIRRRMTIGARVMSPFF